MSNPYESPQFAAETPLNPDEAAARDKLRRIAKYQQWVIYCVLANLVLNIVAIAGQGSAAAGVVLLALLLVVVIASMYSIFMLANEVYYSAAAGVLCAFLMLVPCVSLVTLLVVNGKATTVLRQFGVKVGFMGVNPQTI